jgi:hypothetical protein
MNYARGRSTIWHVVIAFYLLPLILSMSHILSTNRLLGDFAHSFVTDGPVEILFGGAIYLLPLFCIILLVRFADRVRVRNVTGEFGSFLYIMLISVTALAVIFGLPSIGAAAGQGLAGVVQSIVLKFNPNLVFLLFAFSNSSTRRLVIGSFCVLVTGYEQKSLLPIFLVLMASTVHFVINHRVSRLRFFVFALLIVVTAYNIDIFLFDLYQLRNDMRGGSSKMEAELVTSYALGRINSFSSFYYIWSGSCCSEYPDMFYVAANVLERLTGIPLPTLSPTQIFNRDILGSDALDYGIFTSFAGSLLIEGRANFAFLILSSVSLCFFVIFAYKLTPLPSNADRVPLFLLLFYFPYLSGDVWEFAILIQFLVVIRMAIFGVMLLKVALKKSISGKGGGFN